MSHPILSTLKRQTLILLGKEVNQGIQIKRSTQRYGSSYGGWDLCSEDITSSSIIYSFGVGTDITFDLALIENFGVPVYAFDPTPKSIEWVKNQQLPKEFLMHPYGIASSDREALFYPPDNPDFVSHSLLYNSTTVNKAIQVPLLRLSTIMQKLNHTKIDVLKMDIEGAEYEVIEDILSSGIAIHQLLIEFHHRFSNVGVDKTKQAIKQLNQAGYQICCISNSGQEYSFIKTT